MDENQIDRVASVMIEKYGDLALLTAVKAVRHYTELGDFKHLRFWLSVAQRVKSMAQGEESAETTGESLA